MKRACILIAFYCSSMTAQSWNAFNVSLQLDFSSADNLVSLFEGSEGNVRRCAQLRGNRIAAATSMVLARREVPPEAFVKHLESFKAHFSISDDLFGLNETQRRFSDVNALLLECKRRQLDRRVLATIRQFFPEDATVTTTIPVYFVAMGHENASAYVRRIAWNGDTPVFVGEGMGTPVIVVNLTRSAQLYGDTQSRFVEVMSTLAHEAFHAVFSNYQNESPRWQKIHTGETYFSSISELVQNEGIAYYLSMQEVFGGTFPQQFLTRLHQSIPILNSALDELLDPATPPQRARELALNANLSGSMEKNYGAAAGLLIAYQIDTRLGRKALAESIALGPSDFFKKYLGIVKRYADTPALSAQSQAEFLKAN
ncbi:MAG: hypothetical protein NTV54_06925 [Ignavibacteriales bacterium]|nr:hypothetical protein [Ignavibacteriales bacterium]